MRYLIKKSAVILSLSFTLLLMGCINPESQEGGGDVPYPDQIDLIQGAVDSYQEASGGLLPIKTRELETEKYIKYPIEFSAIIPDYTGKIPSNAYEKGGIFQYVLINVEENPTVKLIDLRAAERIRELNLRKNINNGSIPYKDEVGNGVYEIDFKTMGFEKALSVPSPYSDTQLPLVVSGNGNFYIDYSIELQRILSEEKPEIKQGEDIRYLLEEISPVLPAYSLPYTVNDKNEPVFMKSE